MNPTETQTPPPAAPAPPVTSEPPQPAPEPPAASPTPAVPPANPATTAQAPVAGGKKKIMILAVVGVLVLLAVVYFLFLKG